MATATSDHYSRKEIFKNFVGLPGRFVNVQVTRLEGRVDTGPIAAGLKALAINTTTAQKAAQSQLTELQVRVYKLAGVGAAGAQQ